MASFEYMRSILWSGCGIGIVALFLLCANFKTGASTDVLALKVGESFPLVLLPSLVDGKPVSIADFQGEKLVLHIWASW
jgi:hypothetical protein